MSYKCTLTSSNRHIYEDRINKYITTFYILGNDMLLPVIVTFILEYLLSYQYIDTNSEVYQEEAFKHIKLSKSGISLVQIMRNIRNFCIHEPNRLTPNLFISFYNALTPQTISEITSFYIDNSQVTKFLMCMSKVSTYTNIEHYKAKFHMTDEAFKSEKMCLMNLLGVHSDEELDAQIVSLL